MFQRRLIPQKLVFKKLSLVEKKNYWHAQRCVVVLQGGILYGRQGYFAVIMQKCGSTTGLQIQDTKWCNAAQTPAPGVAYNNVIIRSFPPGAASPNPCPSHLILGLLFRYVYKYRQITL